MFCNVEKVFYCYERKKQPSYEMQYFVRKRKAEATAIVFNMVDWRCGIDNRQLKSRMNWLIGRLTKRGRVLYSKCTHCLTAVNSRNDPCPCIRALNDVCDCHGTGCRLHDHCIYVTLSSTLTYVNCCHLELRVDRTYFVENTTLWNCLLILHSLSWRLFDIGRSEWQSWLHSTRNPLFTRCYASVFEDCIHTYAYAYLCHTEKILYGRIHDISSTFLSWERGRGTEKERNIKGVTHWRYDAKPRM